MASEEIESACLRCYVWGSELDLSDLGEALADALVAKGYGATGDDALKSVIVAVSETLPLEDGFADEIEALGSGLVIFPAAEGSKSLKR